MATITSLRGHLVQELHDLLNAEQQLIDALPKLVQQSSSKSLKGAFQRHLAQTRMHERRITQALEALGEAEASHTSEAMEGLIKEGDELMSSGEPGALMDAMLITAAQKVEHYEMATYGTVRTYAAVLGERQVTRLLEQTLKEEKAANKKLTAIAEASVNARAAKEWHERSGASGLLQKGAEWIGSAVGDAMTRVESRRHLGSRVHGRSCRGRTGKPQIESRRSGRRAVHHCVRSLLLLPAATVGGLRQFKSERGDGRGTLRLFRVRTLRVLSRAYLPGRLSSCDDFSTQHNAHEGHMTMARPDA